MAWEELQKTSNDPANKPIVTIHVSGMLYLNRDALDIFGNAEAVRLFFDRETRTVALRKASLSEDNSYRYRVSKQGNRAQVSFRKFCEHFDITYDKATRYPVTIEGDMLTFTIPPETSQNGVLKVQEDMGAGQLTSPQLKTIVMQ